MPALPEFLCILKKSGIQSFADDVKLMQTLQSS